MSSSSPEFNKTAAEIAPERSKAEKPAYPPPFSLRLTHDERAQLDALAGNMTLSAYIRQELLGDGVSTRKRSVRRFVEDEQALARVLGSLGESRLSANLNQLAKAVNSGSLPVTPETEAELLAACRQVMAMREDLLRALGQHPGPTP